MKYLVGPLMLMVGLSGCGRDPVDEYAAGARKILKTDFLSGGGVFSQPLGRLEKGDLRLAAGVDRWGFHQATPLKLGMVLQPDGEVSLPAGRAAIKENSVLRVQRSDRLKINSQTRICISTYGDPKTVSIVESSGEAIGMYIDSFTTETTAALTREFEGRGLPVRLSDREHSRRLVSMGDTNGDVGCVNGPDAIRVEQKVVPGDSPKGYRVSLTAIQGAHRYGAEITRPYAVLMSAQGRPLVRRDEPRTPDGAPYWDVRRDIDELRVAFIRHLFNEGKSN